jgi:hypothetical protein
VFSHGQHSTNTTNTTHSFLNGLPPSFQQTPHFLSSPLNSPSPSSASEVDGTPGDPFCTRPSALQALKNELSVATERLNQANSTISSLLSEMNLLRDEKRKLIFQSDR